MKFHFLFFCFVSVFNGFSQEEELFHISPKWKVGDTKKIHTETSSKVFYNDSLVSSSRSNYDIQLKVLSLDDQCLVSFQSKDKLPSFIPENYTKIKQEKFLLTLADAETEYGFSDFTIRMDNKTGVALELKNGIELSKNIEYKAKKKIKEWGEMMNKSLEEIRDMEIEFGKEWEEISSKIQLAILNKTTKLFSAYNLSFPMNSTFTQKVMTHDITASSQSDTLFPAEMKMETVEVNDKLIVKTYLEYDKQFLLDQLKKSYNSLQNVEPNEVSIIEKEEIIFDLNSTWLLQHSTNLHFEIPGMKTITNSVITLL